MLVLAFVIFLLLFWRQSGPRVIPTTSAVFGHLGTFRTLEQPVSLIDLVASEREGIFRAINPAVTSVGEVQLWSYRITNWVGCPSVSGSKSYTLRAPTVSLLQALFTQCFYDAHVHSSIALRKGDRFLHLDVPELAMVPTCVSGCEDPRFIVDSARQDIFYVVCNARSNARCLSEMHVLVVSMHDVHAAFEDTSEKGIPILETVKLQYEASRSHEKNWMPFRAAHRTILFVYTIAPKHIILSCRLDDGGKCSKLVETENPFFNKDQDVRGGSAPVLYQDGYLTVAHIKFTWNSYASVIYKFSNTFPFQVQGASKLFAFDDSGSPFIEPSCQFASGFDISANYAYLLFGELDCESRIFTLPLEKLLAALSPSVDAQQKRQ